MWHNQQYCYKRQQHHQHKDHEWYQIQVEKLAFPQSQDCISTIKHKTIAHKILTTLKQITYCQSVQLLINIHA